MGMRVQWRIVLLERGTRRPYFWGPPGEVNLELIENEVHFVPFWGEGEGETMVVREEELHGVHEFTKGCICRPEVEEGLDVTRVIHRVGS
jgi:hypothetical protein